jgi:hypothetical protein
MGEVLISMMEDEWDKQWLNFILDWVRIQLWQVKVGLTPDLQKSRNLSHVILSPESNIEIKS